MNSNAEILFTYLRDVIFSPQKAKLDISSLDPDFRDLGEGMQYLVGQIDEVRAFSKQLSKGNLDIEPPGRDNELAAPLKSLHSSLRHMSWQTQQVAAGDYKQHVEFLGEFAESFNTMVRQLDQRQQDLLAEISSGKKKTLALEQSISLLEAITSVIPQWIFVVTRKDHKVLYTNNAAKTALDLDKVLSDNLWVWLYEQAENAHGVEEQLLETALASRSGTRYLSTLLHPVFWHGHNAIAFVIYDVTGAKREIQKLEDVAYRDPLTLAYSRHYGMQTLNDLLDRKQEFCICFADLDGLKFVNDTYGHMIGDRYIILAAEQLSRFPGGVICRLGGDEFMVLAKDISLEAAEEHMERIRESLKSTMLQYDINFAPSMSYGIAAVGTDNTLYASELLSEVDEKMYLHKRANKKTREDYS